MSILLDRPGKNLVVLPDETGSGQVGTSWDRTHCANCSPAATTPPAWEELPADPEGPGFRDEVLALAVVVERLVVGALEPVLPDEGVAFAVPMVTVA
jgi:hypothetical protein